VRILVVEDSGPLRRSLTTALQHSGYVVDATGDGREGFWFAEGNHYDLIILDLMLPGMDGLAFLKQLRARSDNRHVLVLTARSAVEDRVVGLRAGADDYLVKPFALEELLARVDALCRRSYGQKHSVVRFADLEIDLAGRVARRGGQPLDLTPREFRLIEFLALRRGEVVSRFEIEQHLYDAAADPLSNVVESAICTLRKKLGGSDARPLIRTRRGMGYILEVE